MNSHIEFLSSGLYSSLQTSKHHDLGRYGVPKGGAMDNISHSLANHLVGNLEDAHTIEITYNGPNIHFHSSAVIAITGANLSPTLDGKQAPINQCFSVSKNSILKFGKPLSGVRTYLAIKGGILSDCPLITKPIQKGDLLKIKVSSIIKAATSKVKQPHILPDTPPISVLKGPEFNLLSPSNVKHLFAISYEIMLASNRMGIRLQGDSLRIKTTDMLTSPVLPGTVQLPPSGIPIVLMKDCQTTGGYPRILHLPEHSIATLAQRPWRQQIQFNLMD